jgi:hypothetical protein
MLEAAIKCGFADPQLIKELESILTTYFSQGFNHDYLASREWVSSE